MSILFDTVIPLFEIYFKEIIRDLYIQMIIAVIDIMANILNSLKNREINKLVVESYYKVLHNHSKLCFQKIIL